MPDPLGPLMPAPLFPFATRRLTATSVWRRPVVAFLSTALVFWSTASLGFDSQDQANTRAATVLAQWTTAVTPADCGAPPRCLWAELARAGAVLSTAPQEPARDAAEAAIRTAVEETRQLHGWRRVIGAAVDPVWDMPFLTGALLLQIELKFGQTAGVNRIISRRTSDMIRHMFLDWQIGACPAESNNGVDIWRPWFSENHDLFHTLACWGSAVFCREDVSCSSSFGQASVEQIERVLARSFDDRVRSGIFIEIFSPTYSKYALAVAYLIADHAMDAALRGRAADMIAIWWVMWHQEQRFGRHLGAQVRAYSRPGRPQEPTDVMYWVYSGRASQPRTKVHPAWIVMLLSKLRLPPAVRYVLSREPPIRYDVTTWHLGVGAGRRDSRERLDVSRKEVRVGRVLHVDQGFAMSSFRIPLWNVDRWSPISSQNRLSGVRFLNANGPGGVFVMAKPINGRTEYNGLFTQQQGNRVRATLLRAPYSRGVQRMRVCVYGAEIVSSSANILIIRDTAWVGVSIFGGSLAATAVDGCYDVSGRDPVAVMIAERLEKWRDVGAFERELERVGTLEGDDRGSLPPAPSPTPGPLEDADVSGGPLSGPFMRQSADRNVIDIGIDGISYRIKVD
jgi:hypothetical protein